MISNQKLYMKFLIVLIVAALINVLSFNAVQADTLVVKPTFSKPSYAPAKGQSGSGTMWSGYITTDNINGWGYQTPYLNQAEYDTTEGQRLEFELDDPFDAGDGTTKQGNIRDVDFVSLDIRNIGKNRNLDGVSVDFRKSMVQ